MSHEKDDIELDGYHLVEQLYCGSNSVVYRAVPTHPVKGETLDSVIIKLLTADDPSLQDLLKFRHQYTIAKNLDFPGVVRPFTLEEYHRGYALVMEDFGGISLAEYQSRCTLSLTEILQIGIQIADILHALHLRKVIHKDINPVNILINPISEQVKLIDFGLSSLLFRETQEVLSPSLLEGTLAYLSPEQTGRMNRGIDYRTDFYALGVTLYQLLTGRLPFETRDLMELVHCHLAQVPAPIHQFQPNIPQAISQIIAKLMAKDIEKRYQSALGLKYDLERCLEQWQKNNAIRPFDLGQRDLSDRFLIPEKLYGREVEVQALLAAFQRVAQGSSELMLVAGFSGIGKTAVINEVHKPIVRKRGYFVKGKYDQFNGNIPLSAFVQALRNLMEQLLAEPDAKLIQWKAAMMAAVGENGQVLIEVIPELERIIGNQPPALELSGNAAQNRFNLLFQKFIAILATPEHPLVIFLDDLQWADFASLQLLKVLMNDNCYLLILGAYRDNEVSPVHPFILTLEELRKAQATISTILLAPLTIKNTNDLVADTLKCSATIAQPLTELITRKTKGNPFFTIQFLKALHEDGYLQFDRDHRYWKCDIAEVSTLALTDDVLAFMVIQLQKLPAVTQGILKLAACIGNQFDLETLAIISEQSQQESASALWKAMQEGLILPTSQIYKFFTDSEQNEVKNTEAENIVNPIYRFLHDRVQQAAYSLIPDIQRQYTHLHIGQLLLQNTAEAVRESKIFDIVNHLNVGKQLITQSSEQANLAQLNFAAGCKARASTAYAAAVNYFAVAMELLPAGSWSSSYEFTLSLYEAAIEAAYLSGRFEQVDQIASVTLNTAKTLLDKITTYETQIQAYLAQNRLSDAIEIALDVLSQLGIQLPHHPNQRHILLALAKNKLLLGRKKISDLLNLPVMSNPEALAAMRILASASSVAYITVPKLFPLLVFQQIRLSLQYGNTALSASTYCYYGLILSGVFLDIDTGYEFSQLALQLLEKLNARSIRSKVLLLVNAFIAVWKQPLHAMLPGLEEGYQVGLETGDVEYAGWAISSRGRYLYWSGHPLADLQEILQRYDEAVAQLKQHNALIFIKILRQVVLNLLGESVDPAILDGSAYTKEQNTQQEVAGERTSVMLYYINQVYLSYLFGDFPNAIHSANLAKRYEDSGTAMGEIMPLVFYESLAQLALYPTISKLEQKHCLRHVHQNLKRLKKWSDYAPANALHKFHLVEAERLRVLGKWLPAQDRYEFAIAQARGQGYIQEAALANELTAKFYLEWGKEKIAATYIQAACDAYQSWGAIAKITELQKRYAQLLKPVLKPLTPIEQAVSPSQRTTESSSGNSSEALDLATLLNASQAISGEIELPKLLATLLTFTLANAGADRGVLLLQSELGLQTVAMLESGQQTQVLSPPRLVDTSDDVLLGVVNHVKHYLEPLILANALEDTQFAGDPYLLRNQPYSVLCSPILHQGKLLAILYLENHQTANVFTRDRLKILNILCSQAAISLENAQLYQKSQQSLETLRSSEARIQAISNNLPGVIIQICINPQTNYSYTSYISAGCYDLYEITVEEMISKQRSLREFEHPDDVARINEAVKESIQNFTEFRQEFRIITPSGKVKWVKVASQPRHRADGFIVWDGIQMDISERKQAQINLTESESKFRSLVEDTSDVFYSFNLEGIFTYVSPQIEEMTGYHPSEIVGQPCAAFTHPGDIPAMLADIQKILQTGTKQNGLKLRVLRKDGGWCHIVFNSSPIKDIRGQITGIQGVGRDITAQKAVLEERQQQADALRIIVEKTAGKTGTAFYQACTQYLTEIFNVQYAFIAKLTDQTCTQIQILCFWTGEEFLPPFTTNVAGTPCLATYQNSFSIFPRQLQSLFPESPTLASLEAESYMSVVIHDFAGNILGNLAVLDTKPLPSETSALKFILQLFANRVAAEMERQADEDELRQTNQRLEQTIEELQRATRLKDEFLATMSHELRTPLNAVLGMTEILQDGILGAVNERQLKSLMTIERSGEHLLSLITDILDVSKISAGKLDIDIQPVSVVELIDTSLMPIRQSAQEKQIRLEVNVIPDAGWITVDERRICQVLMNLLSNAVKFTPAGGQVSIRYRVDNSNGWAEFAVIDTGIGISAADQAQLFQPFVQLDSRLNRQYEGTGLGLALVKQIVELHGGRVVLESELGQGSCFTMQLPLQPVTR